MTVDLSLGVSQVCIVSEQYDLGSLEQLLQSGQLRWTCPPVRRVHTSTRSHSCICDDVDDGHDDGD